jgi:AraC-like DNA-binding protein
VGSGPGLRSVSPLAVSRSIGAAIVGPVRTEDLVHLRRARDVIDRDYAQPLNVPEMARVACCSPSHFSRRYREAFGETPWQHLSTRRVERARTLLRETEMSVTEICLTVGFTSLGSFSTRFRELCGTSPTAYRASAPATAGIPGCMVGGLARSSRNGVAAGAART